MVIDTTETSRVEAPRSSNILGRSSVQIVALLVLFTAAAIHESFRITAFMNGDVWWHLRTGMWMLQNHSLAHTGLFSQYSSSPWANTNWGFDVLIAVVYKLLGLRAIPALLMAFKVVLALVSFQLARGWDGNFWGAVGLSAVAQYAIADLQPLPILCSILFFGVELALLFSSRRTGDLRPLYLLPPLFFVWANLHMQFVCGLLVLGLYLVAEIVQRLLGWKSAAPASVLDRSIGKVCAIVALSAGATLLTPYGLHLFSNGFSTIYSRVLLDNFQEMHSMEFRQPQHFVLLLLVMGAFLTLGRQRSRSLFKIGTMAIFAMLAFRIQRDVWCVVLPAIAVIADALVDCQCSSRNSSAWKWERPLTAALVLATLTIAIVRLPGDEALMQRASAMFPAKASDFIRTNQLPGPLFNDFAWGGFLTWYLPEYPVAIDGRLNLYGDELTATYFDAIAGKQRLETYPSFNTCRTLLLPRNSGMTKALISVPALSKQFRVVYQDEIATVIVRQ